MSINNTNVYSFKSASSRLSNYKIYGSDKYTANYKIYGNTIDGSSVGNLVNLFDENSEVTTLNFIDDNGVLTYNANVDTYDYISVEPNTTYRAKSFGIGSGSLSIREAYYDSSKTFISRVISNKNSTFTTPINCVYIRLSIDNAKPIHDLQISLTKGDSDPATYEPYGYKVPIRVTGKNLWNANILTDEYINATGSLAIGSNGDKFLYQKININSSTTYTFSWNQNVLGINNYSAYIRISEYTEDHQFIKRILCHCSEYQNNIFIFTTSETASYIDIRMDSSSSDRHQHLTGAMLIKGSATEEYEPYRESIENVYLDSPLTKSGDNTDYIDFKEQKRVNIDGTEEYIKLPELKIESENDSIFIDTDTQPSNIDFDILHGVGDRTENLANPNDLQQGYYAYADGSSVLGNLKWVCTQKIPCKSNTNYTFSFKNPSRWAGFVWYDSSDTYISTVNRATGFTNGGYYTAQSPSNAAYFVVNIAGYPDVDSSITVDNIIDLMIEEGSTPSEYEPYGYKIPIKVQGKNLFIKPVEQGAIYTANGGYTPNDTAKIYSKNIPLIPGKTYTISCNNNLKLRFIASYFNDTYIGHLYLNTSSSTVESQTTITMPENANNISVSFWNGDNSATVVPSDLEWCQIEEGETATEYEEPFNQITNIYLDKPLLKVGDNVDYVDYSVQKKYTYNNTVEDVVLPDIPVNVGENKLMIDTLIKPSNTSISVSNTNGGSIPVVTNNKYEKIKHIFKTTEDTLRNYRIYGNNKYGANYRIYGNTTEIPENLFDENSTWNIHSYINTDNTFPYGSGTNCRTYFMKVTGLTTYKINMTSCGDRLKVVYYTTTIDPTTYTTSNKVTATGVLYSSNGDTGNGAITSGKNLCMTFTTPRYARVIGIYYSLSTLPTGFTITEVKDNYSVGNLANLFDENSEVIPHNYIDDNGVLTYNTNIDTYDYIPVEPNATYRAKSFGIGSGSLNIRAAYYDSSKTFISRFISNKNSTFTTPINCAYIRLSIDNANRPIHDLQISLTEGSTDPVTYEPHKYKVPIRVTGKNLLKGVTNQTISGVTFTVNSDGSVTCNGTASALTFYAIRIYLQKGSYIISGCPQNGSTTSYMVTMRNGINSDPYTNINGDDTGNSKLMTITEYLYFMYVIRITSGYTCNNLTFYPMIRRADIEDDTYEPYEEQVEYLYLDSPLIKSGDNCDYIDFKEQKRVNIDGTTEYIKLPEFNISENSSIFVDTDTQPSNIDFDISHGVGDGGYSYNILPMSLTPKTETHGDFLCEYDGLGTIKLTTTKNNASTITDFIIPLEKPITFPQSISQGGTGCFQLNNTSDKYPNSSSDGRLYFYNDNTCIASWYIYKSSSGLNIVNSSYTEMSLKTVNSVHIRINNLGEARTLTIKPLLIENVTSQVPFIPYFSYKIPIKVQGKNLFNSSVDQGGLNSENGTEYIAGLYYTNRLHSDYINLTSNKTYTISSNMKIKMIIAYNENKYISCLLNTNGDLLYSTITLPSNANNIRVVFWSGTNDIEVEPSNFEWCQIQEGDVVTEYEEPFSSTNNIYLNRPLLKDDSGYDYIDYSEQKRYNYDGTIENIIIQNVLTNNGMNTLTFDSFVQPLQSFIRYYDEDAKIPVIDSSSSFEASFTTSGTQLLNYRIWGTNNGLGNTNLFDFDAWWETIKNNAHNGSVKREKNQSFTITPTAGDAYTDLYASSSTGGYKIYVEPNSSYTWSWNKECTNSAYYGKQMIFLDGRAETGYMFTCTSSTSLTFTTKSDTSFIMLRFGAGTNNTDTPITFSNITLSKNNSNPNILLNISDLNDIATWDSNLYARPTKTVENNSWVIGQIIDVTNINSLYIVGDTKIVYDNIIRVGKSNEQITNGSTLLSYTTFTKLPCIIDTSDCNYIIISVSIYNNYNNTTFEQIKNTFKIYKAQPNTTIITLPRKLFKTDTNIEYIDYESQKLYSADNTSTNISLPPISTVVGKNKLRIPPDKKPSKIMIHYKQ